MSEAASEIPDFRVPILIGDDALNEGIDYIRKQKEIAIDNQDFEAAAEWRDEEKKLIKALGGNGLLAVETKSAED